jgi:hypothetical protein
VHTSSSEQVAPTPAAEGREGQDGKKKKKPPKPPSIWDRLNTLGPIITPIIVLVIGYWLKDSVDNAIKRQELQLSNVKEMREELAAIQKADVTPEAVQASAFTLAAFGQHAVPPLLTVLSSGDEIRRPAAERALRAVGLTDPEAVCGPIARVIDNRTGRFNWLTLQSAIRLAGDLTCTNARPALERQNLLLRDINGASDLPKLTSHDYVDPDPPLDLDAVKQLKAEVTRALTIVKSL